MNNSNLPIQCIFFILVTMIAAPIISTPANPLSGAKAVVPATAKFAYQPSDPVITFTADQRREQQDAAVMLLEKAPVVDAKDRLEKDEFITFTRGVSFKSVKIGNFKQAIAELEQILAGAGDASATLKSDPEKNDVTYRRYVDDSAPWQSATTNTQISLRPALYVFRCTDKKSGQTQEKTQSCTSKCTVEFKF